MKIFGYSERGIINSLIFNIGENMELMNKFLQLITIPTSLDLEEPTDYTILLEQSLSRFGDSDLIIIVKYKNPADNIVLFFEGKVKTSQVNWKINSQFNKYNSNEQYSGYSSNLFFQLYLKKLLIENYTEIKENGEVLEPQFGDNRKIGNNPIVLNAFDLIKCNKAYYIGIVPTLNEDLKQFTDSSISEIYFLSWETIHEFCKDNNLEKVLEVFDYNKEQIYAPKFHTSGYS